MGKIIGALAGIAAGTAALISSGGNPWLAFTAATSAAGIVTSLGRKPKQYYDSVKSTPSQIFLTMEENLPIPLLYGKCKVSGNVIQGSDNSLHIAFCQGEINSFSNVRINDIAVAQVTDKDGVAGGVDYDEYKGTATQTADSRFAVGSRLAYRPTAYIGFTFEQSFQTSGGIPNITTEIEGKLCRPLTDLAAGTPVYTRNNAVVGADFLINVMGVSASDIDTTSFQALETYCDTKPSGASVERFRFDYCYSSFEPIPDALKIIEASCHCRFIRAQAKWYARYEKSGSSVYSFTVDNIVLGSLSWRLKQRYNIFRIKYTNNADDFRNDMIEIRDETSIAQVGEQVFDEQCYYIADTEVARRRAQFRFNKAKYCKILAELTGFPESGTLEVFDIIDVTHSTPGWASKKFVILDKEQDEFGRPKFTLEEYNSVVYDDLLAPEQSNDTTTLPSPFDLPTAPTIALTTNYKLMDNGTYMPQIAIAITEPSSIFPLKYEIWYRKSSGTSEYHGETYESTYYIDAPDPATYYVKVRSVNSGSNVKGAFTSESSIAIVHETIEPLNAFTVVSNYSDLGVYPVGLQREVVQEIKNKYDPSSGERLAPVVAIDFVYTTQPIKEILTKGILPKVVSSAQLTGTATASGNTLTDASNDYTAIFGSLLNNYVISFSGTTDGTEHKIIGVASDGGSGTIMTVTGTPKSGKYFIVSRKDII